MRLGTFLSCSLFSVSFKLIRSWPQQPVNSEIYLLNSIIDCLGSLVLY